ncbi:hypothetical protein [Burkholderia cenocepacia]|uniref:hypothetical protein n=1 Tax=Burkholderia cenocepacia TaxID=95486 RepID=UPI000F57C737|nr:hypothetical protein [Burkholderia cenocepacia]
MDILIGTYTHFSRVQRIVHSQKKSAQAKNNRHPTWEPALCTHSERDFLVEPAREEPSDIGLTLRAAARAVAAAIDIHVRLRRDARN